VSDSGAIKASIVGVLAGALLAWGYGMGDGMAAAEKAACAYAAPSPHHAGVTYTMAKDRSCVPAAFYQED